MDIGQGQVRPIELGRCIDCPYYTPVCDCSIRDHILSMAHPTEGCPLPVLDELLRMPVAGEA